MKTTWHILRKDLRLMRWPILCWTLLLLGKLVLYASIAGLFGQPNFALLSQISRGATPYFFVGIEPLIAFFLIARLVFDDALVQKDAFWVTRPISGWQLLMAKLIGAELLFALLPAVLNIPWLIA